MLIVNLLAQGFARRGLSAVPSSRNAFGSGTVKSAQSKDQFSLLDQINIALTGVFDNNI
jgi:hypothetical protein